MILCSFALGTVVGVDVVVVFVVLSWLVILVYMRHTQKFFFFSYQEEAK